MGLIENPRKIVFAATAAAALLLTPGAAHSEGWLDNLKAAGSKLVQDVETGLKKGAEGAQQAQGGLEGAHTAVNTNKIRGRVALQKNQTLTCFEGVPAGYIGPANMTSPTQAKGTPSIIVTKSGMMNANLCDDLASKGVLVLDTPPATVPGQHGKKLASNDPCNPNGDGTWSGKGGATRAAICDAQGVNAQIFAAEEARRAAAREATANNGQPQKPAKRSMSLIGEAQAAEKPKP